MLPHADTIVVVVRLGHTRIDSAAKTAETLRALGITQFLLVVIGGATDRRSTYYGYYYGYTTPAYNPPPPSSPSRRRRSDQYAETLDTD